MLRGKVEAEQISSNQAKKKIIVIG